MKLHTPRLSGRWLVAVVFAIAVVSGIMALAITRQHSASDQSKPISRASSSVTEKSPSTPATKPKPQPATWGSLKISAIGVDAPLEAVGLDTKKRMAVPQGEANAGWYKLGHHPGAAGNAVIAAHLSLVGGKHGIFYDLAKLKAGDRVEVTDSQHKHWQFAVTDMAVYGRDNFPLQDVFDGQRKEPQLKLITCESYDSSAKAYNDRRVVTATLIQSKI